MLDDAGFGHADTFGGEIHTPTLTRLAETGISYNAFHTTAMCSPTRAAIITGRNPHEQKRSTNTEWTLFEGISRIPESQAPNVRNGNLRAEIEAEVPKNVNGVIFAMGGYAGGVSRYVENGKLYYEYSAVEYSLSASWTPHQGIGPVEGTFAC